MLLFSAAKYANLQSSFPVILFAQAVGYLLAIFLYYGIARLIFGGHNTPIWIGFVGAVVLGYLLTGRNEVWKLMCEWSMLFGASVTVGALARRRASSGMFYGAGLAVIVAFSLLWIVPQWGDLSRAMQLVAERAVDDLRRSGVASVLGASGAEYEESVREFMNLMSRFLPALIGMGAVTQYSIGTLMFERQYAVATNRCSLIDSFTHWRLPRTVTVALLIALGLRFVTHGTAQMATDNVLAAASPFYCAVGLGLFEYYLQLFRFHWALKLIFYLALIPTGITGYFVMVLFGLITSLYDWRKQPGIA